MISKKLMNHVRKKLMNLFWYSWTAVLSPLAMSVVNPVSRDRAHRYEAARSLVVSSPEAVCPEVKETPAASIGR